MVQDREQWRTVLEEAEVHKGLEEEKGGGGEEGGREGGWGGEGGREEK
jgi:hypothetical protein